MVFISFQKPGHKAISNCLNQSQSGQFNYDKKYVGATKDGAEALDGVALTGDGYVRDHTRVCVGSGRAAFHKCRDIVSKWGHFQLGWAQVDPATPLKAGGKVCVCGKSLFVWTLNPLEILYVHSKAAKDETLPEDVSNSHSFSSKQSSQRSASSVALSPSAPSSVRQTLSSSVLPKRKDQFSFGHGTLRGHMLAGEERFSVEWMEEDDSVWYEILSFSKPANALSAAAYPLARFLQRRFAEESSRKVVEAAAAADQPAS